MGLLGPQEPLSFTAVVSLWVPCIYGVLYRDVILSFTLIFQNNVMQNSKNTIISVYGWI